MGNVCNACQMSLTSAKHHYWIFCGLAGIPCPKLRIIASRVDNKWVLQRIGKVQGHLLLSLKGSEDRRGSA